MRRTPEHDELLSHARKAHQLPVGAYDVAVVLSTDAEIEIVALLYLQIGVAAHRNRDPKQLAQGRHPHVAPCVEQQRDRPG